MSEIKFYLFEFAIYLFESELNVFEFGLFIFAFGVDLFELRIQLLNLDFIFLNLCLKMCSRDNRCSNGKIIGEEWLHPPPELRNRATNFDGPCS